MAGPTRKRLQEQGRGENTLAAGGVLAGSISEKSLPCGLTGCLERSQRAPGKRGSWGEESACEIDQPVPIGQVKPFLRKHVDLTGDRQ